MKDAFDLWWENGRVRFFANPAGGPERLFAVASGMRAAVVAANGMCPSRARVGRNDRGA
jgi:hypothetical protein